MKDALGEVRQEHREIGQEAAAQSKETVHFPTIKEVIRQHLLTQIVLNTIYF